MKKTILAGVVLIVIVLSPLAESRAGGYISSPGIYFGINWKTSVYDKIWIPGHWEHFRGNWRWFDGYWGERRYVRDHRAVDIKRRLLSRARWIQGHWEHRHGDRVWVEGHWKKKHKPLAYQSKKLRGRAQYREAHDRNYSRR